MDETLKRISTLLKKFNNSFVISTNVTEENGEQIADGLKIDNVKNNGVEFMDDLFNMFNDIIKNVSNEHELIYNEEKGLVIAKKVVTIDYILEE